MAPSPKKDGWQLTRPVRAGRPGRVGQHGEGQIPAISAAAVERTPISDQDREPHHTEKRRELVGQTEVCAVHRQQSTADAGHQSAQAGHRHLHLHDADAGSVLRARAGCHDAFMASPMSNGA